MKKHRNWKKVVGILRVHTWLTEVYGNIKVCEGKDCRKISTNYDWALIHGKQYERKRKNFKRLCRSCHLRYDLTPEKREALNKIRDEYLKNPKPYHRFKKGSLNWNRSQGIMKRAKRTVEEKKTYIREWKRKNPEKVDMYIRNKTLPS